MWFSIILVRPSPAALSLKICCLFEVLSDRLVAPDSSFCFFGSSYLASLCLVSVSAAGLQRVISNSTSDSSR